MKGRNLINKQYLIPDDDEIFSEDELQQLNLLADIIIATILKND